MCRIYRFRIWTMDNTCYLYDGVFENAKEAQAFINENYLDPDNAGLRIDAIDFIDSALVNLYSWTPTCSKWYDPMPLYINDPIGVMPIKY